MKRKLGLLWVVFLGIIACKNTAEQSVNQPDIKQEKKFAVDDDLLETAVIYEANVRQYSPEGTLNAFAKDLPGLKKLGVKIIWLMPVYPISETKRKATGDSFVSDIENPAGRSKYLGSPYAVADYKAVNPDLGTLEDLQNLVKQAHKNEMAVILDWVANHTGWDHPWIKEHPEFYTKNEKGEITDPLNEDGSSKGWQDVADLNYDNPELRKAMVDAMKYWLGAADIDGFRCDVAGEVPVSFWREAIPQLRAEKPLFMLAEAWEPELLKDNLFDACYGWESHFLLADIAKGKKTVADWDAYVKKIDTMYEPDDILMNFVANHDENSWKGTVSETFGDYAEAMTALTFAIKGMPLIYSGQEYGLNHRLKFFEKDSIPKTKGKWFDLYSRLGQLKNTNPALNGGKHPSDYQRIKTNDDKNILAFVRSKNGKKILFILNANHEGKISLDFTGKLTGYFSGKSFDYKANEAMELGKGDYRIYLVEPLKKDK